MSGRVDPVETFLIGQIRAGAMPGAAWWVGDRRGAISRGSVGHAAVTPRLEPARDDTPYDLASLTKPLATAILAIALQSERRLDLDSPLAVWFPSLRRTAYDRATVRDAGMHRARFPAWMPLYVAGTTREAYVDAIAGAPPLAEDATVYSDLGYVLLGFLLESVAGASLEGLFGERIGRRLGLRRCGFAGTGQAFADAAATERGNAYERKLAGEAAKGYAFRTEVIRGHVHDANAWGLGGIAGHAGLFGTAADVASVALAILDPAGLGLPGAALEAMRRPPSVEPGRRTFGLLRAADAESVRGVLSDDAVGHFGFTGTSLWIDPTVPRIYVLLTNRVHPVVPGVDFARTRHGFHAAAAAL